MLRDDYYTPPTELDLLLFQKLVPAQHYLRRVKEHIDFDSLRDKVADCYSRDRGSPAEDPARRVKFEFLQYHYNLSDREVITQAQVNIAFRFFLDLSLESELPHPSTLSVFRQRLGAEKHQQLFAEVVAQAREKGLVKDRLRLKDATHVLANIAIPCTLRLVAQTRQHLLEAARPFDPERVAAEEDEAARLREVTQDLNDAERLVQRVEHLRRIRDWTQALCQQQTPPAQALVEAIEQADKVLEDRDHPEAGNPLLSLDDPDARRGRHGHFYNGYLLDVTVDADSEIITALDVLPANADEAKDATALIEQEQQAHHNRVEALSLDGIGFRGDQLREWTDPEGLNLCVYVPPSPLPAPTGLFEPQDFCQNPQAGTLTCPGGQTTPTRQRTRHDTGWQYLFARSVCAHCPLQAACLSRLPKSSGRTVAKNDYEAEYAAARQKALTPEYARVRSEHARIERKLGEIVRHHEGRYARYRGHPRVRIQELLSGLVVNVKRIVRLMSDKPQASAPAAAT